MTRRTFDDKIKRRWDMSLETKKTLIIRLYQVLYEYSDSEHPLTQSEIIDLLDKNYGVEAERKAIGRNVSCLMEMGVDIVNTRKGCYLAERPFENSELRILIDSVLCSRHINAGHSRELIDKLIKLGGRNFKAHVKHVFSVSDWSKSENNAFFYNVDLIDEAIENDRQITFDYNKYGIDKKLHKSKSHKVSPYQMILRNQHYFLMAYEEYWGNMTFYRVDKISNIHIQESSRTPLREVKGYEHGINYKEIALSRPYMFSDKPEKITLTCPEWFFDEIADWFGTDVGVKATDDKTIKVTLTASPRAMEYWAMQYCNYAEVVSPQHLRDSIKEKLASAAEKYK